MVEGSELPVLKCPGKTDAGILLHMLGDTVELGITEVWTSVKITGPELAVLPIEEDLKETFCPPAYCETQ